MNRTKSILIAVISTTVLITTPGCYTDDRTYGPAIYDPAGSPNGYYRDGHYYSPGRERSHQWDYYERNNERHQWDNYQQDWR